MARAWVGCLLLGVTTCLADPEIPTKHFFGTPDVSNLLISPNGALAMAKNKDGIAIARLEDMSRVGGFKIKEAYREVYQMYWLTDKRIMFSLTARALGGGDVQYLTGEYYAMNIDGSRSIQLFGDELTYHRVISLLKDDPDHILVEGKVPTQAGGLSNARPTAFKRNIHKRSRNTNTFIDAGGRKKVGGPSPIPTGSLYADHAGQVRLAVGRRFDSNHTEIQHRWSNKAEWEDITDRLGARSDTTLQPIGFTADNRAFYFTSRRDGDTTGVSIYDIENETAELIFRDPDVDLSRLLMNADETKPFGAVLERAYPETVFFDPSVEDAQVLRSLERVFPGQRVVVTSRSRDGTRAILGVTNDRNPGEFYFFDRDAKRLRPLGVKIRPDLDPARLRPTEAFMVEARDGVKLTGYVTKPDDDRKKHPLVVVPHGGPHGVRDTWRFDPEAQFLANRGFAVMHVNFRGSGGQGQRFEEAGYRQWGGTMIDDIVDATRWISSQDYIDGARMCIYGASYGGFAAVSAVIKEPDLYRCAIGYVGIYDLELMYGKGDIPTHPGGKAYLSKVIGQSEAELKAFSPVHNADRIEVPVMIAHGGLDRRAPIAHAYRLRDAFDEAGVEYEWYVESGEAHGFYDDENQVKLYDAMVAFLREHTSANAERLE